MSRVLEKILREKFPEHVRQTERLGFNEKYLHEIKQIPFNQREQELSNKRANHGERFYKFFEKWYLRIKNVYFKLTFIGFLLATIGFGAWVYQKNQQINNLAQKIENLDTTVATQNKTIAKQDSTNTLLVNLINGDYASVAPDTMTLYGGYIPLDDYWIRRDINIIIEHELKDRVAVRMTLEALNFYKEEFLKAMGGKYHPDIIYKIAVETKGMEFAESLAAAKGIIQIMPETYNSLADEPITDEVDGRRDPITSFQIAKKYYDNARWFSGRQVELTRIWNISIKGYRKNAALFDFLPEEKRAWYVIDNIQNYMFIISQAAWKIIHVYHRKLGIEYNENLKYPEYKYVQVKFSGDYVRYSELASILYCRPTLLLALNPQFIKEVGPRFRKEWVIANNGNEGRKIRIPKKVNLSSINRQMANELGVKIYSLN